MFILASLTSGGRSVGIVRLQTTSHGVSVTGIEDFKSPTCMCLVVMAVYNLGIGNFKSVGSAVLAALVRANFQL
jgi:hypothetical protein